MTSWPAASDLAIGFAHSAYRVRQAYEASGGRGAVFEANTLEDLAARVGEVDALVVSGFWRNEFIERAPRLRFIQSMSAGTDQFDKERLKAAGIRLASAQGCNERAVAEHAMALILALARQIHLARDNQAARIWRPMVTDRARREDELGGKTLVIVGLGRIGLRLAALASAFGMRIIGVRRKLGSEPGIERIVAPSALADAVREADIVALTCPLTRETEGLVDARVLAAMRPTASLINVARGRVVDEPALIAALGAGTIAGAGLDCVHDEPLPASSPLWAMPNVLITPHSAGETLAYEGNVVEILTDNLGRLARGETELRNQVV